MKEQRHEAVIGHQCEKCGHDRPHHLDRFWNGSYYTVICFQCLRASKKVQRYPCSCKTRQGKPCPNPGDRVGPSGARYCHVHDPAGTCQKKIGVARSKNIRVARALENMRKQVGPPRTVHAKGTNPNCPFDPA